MTNAPSPPNKAFDPLNHRREVPLDHALARSLIGEQFPALPADRAELLGSGWDFDAFAVADRWVFRFPSGPTPRRG